jgi:hypothetical protein
MASKKLSNEAFGAIPHNGVSDLLTGCDSESRRTKLIGQRETGHEAGPPSRPAFVHSCKFGTPAELGYDDTDNRLRPLARRRLRTVRPFFVAMRTRKP